MYTQSEISNSLKNLKISKNDNIYCSSSLGMLGIPKFSAENIDDICSIFFETLFSLIGPKGTIFVPTFTYSFSTKKNSRNVFDVLNSKSKTSPFSEFVRNRNESSRSKDPMVSVSSIGRNKNILFEQGNSSYGRKCTFENLLKLGNLKLLNIGIGTNYIPFLHYVDYKTRCSHRYNKYFNGLILNGSKKKKVNWHYPVPYKRIEAVSNGYKVAKRAKRFFFSEKLGLGNVYVSDYNKLYEFVLDIAKSNPWITANGPPFR